MQYFGGKQRISKKISEVILPYSKNIDYIEPFVGSSNVMSKITNAKNRFGYDKHFYLIQMYQALQKGWIPPDNITEEEYKHIKNNKDLFDPSLVGFVGFGCSYSGIWFSGYAKNNQERNYCKVSKNGIMKKMKTLKNVIYECKDFSLLDFNNSIIYCDPPYKNTSPYNEELLGKFDYDLFLKWTVKQSKKNRMFISEYKHNVPEYGKILWEETRMRDIKGKNNKRVFTIEVLYTIN